MKRREFFSKGLPAMIAAPVAAVLAPSAKKVEISGKSITLVGCNIDGNLTLRSEEVSTISNSFFKVSE